ncbi:hypothetical protein [Humibacter sp. RRB41]|nr:hypothetical protein [Humibacter sp. RRB41]
MIDGERLKTWLGERAATGKPLVAAVYEGLLRRIERGDFDKESD